MLSSIAAFLQDRTMAAGIAYSFLFIGYYGFLVALSILLAVRFPRRGLIMIGIILIYTATNLSGESLSDSVAKARMATNASALRLLLVASWFGLLFSVVLALASKMGRRKQ